MFVPLENVYKRHIKQRTIAQSTFSNPIEVCEREMEMENEQKYQIEGKKINYVGSNHFAYARDRLSF